jgi:hypothetical protein
MRFLIITIFCLNVFGTGGNGHGVWPTERRVVDLNELLSFKPNFNLRPFNTLYKFDKDHEVLLLKTKSRYLAIKSFSEIERYEELKDEMEDRLASDLSWGITEEEAKENIKATVNDSEIVPFKVPDFL